MSMIKVKKKEGKTVEAYRLGEEHVKLDELMEKKLLVEKKSGIYEVFSQEAVNKEGGEIAHAGYYIKIDSAGYPYPLKSEYFLKEHKRLSGNKYEQIPKPLDAFVWSEGEEMCEEILYLIQEKALVIDKENEAKFYTAPLWGTMLSARKDAVVVFYQIERDETGKILDIDFNFVERSEFEKTYNYLEGIHGAEC